MGSITPFMAQQMQERLASKLRKTTVRGAVVQDSLTTEPPDAAPLGEEIKALHEPFIQLLDHYGIVYAYSRPDKPTTNRKGQFDFLCLYLGAGCACEFKAHPNPEKHLSDAQKEWRKWANNSHVPTLVTNSVQEAWAFVKKELELKL